MSEQENCCECGQIVWASNRVEIEGRVYHGGCLQHKREEDAIGGWCQREIDRDFANDFVDVFGGFPKDDAVKMLVRRLREVRTNAAIAVRQEYMLSLRKRAKMLRESVDPTRATFNVEAVCFILEEEARARRDMREILMAREPIQCDPGFVDMYEFCRRTGLSVRHVYESIRLGKIPARKIKGKWQIEQGVLDDRLARRAAEEGGDNVGQNRGD